jgi:hypothetical protein
VTTAVQEAGDTLLVEIRAQRTQDGAAVVELTRKAVAQRSSAAL